MLRLIYFQVLEPYLPESPDSYPDLETFFNTSSQYSIFGSWLKVIQFILFACWHFFYFRTDLFSINLKKIVHLNFKLLIFCMHTASFKIRISEIGNFEFSPLKYDQKGILNVLYDDGRGIALLNLRKMDTKQTVF